MKRVSISLCFTSGSLKVALWGEQMTSGLLLLPAAVRGFCAPCSTFCLTAAST